MDRIVFFEIEEWEKEYFKKAFPDYEVVFTKDRLEPENVERFKDAKIISTFIYSDINKQIIDSFEGLKLIATRSVGFDHIDLKACKEKEIIVSNIPKYGGDTVAQHTFALILAISRKLIPSVERTRHGDFDLDGLTGFDLSGKTLGVIGAGHIGKKVIEMALCFGMRILVFNRSEDEELKKNPRVRYVDLNTLISSSDIVTLHLPSGTETEHIINMENIKRFKKGSVLINTARGQLVETQAILEGLERGILKGAGLDVLEEEGTLHEERELLTSDFLRSCDIKTQLLNHVLMFRDDVVITPHNAFNSKEALEEIIGTTIDNIKKFLSNQPQNTVNP